jgi:hypothetical protein
MSSKKSESLDDGNTTTMRVSRKTLRMMQIIAAWKNISLSVYLDHLVKTQGVKDLADMKIGVSELTIESELENSGLNENTDSK